MITVNRLQRVAFPLLLCAGACLTQADPVASVKLRQFATATGQETWQTFGSLDCQDGYAAVRATISGNAEFNTLIWYWDRTSGEIRFREGFTSVEDHPLPGNPTFVRAGQIFDTVSINRNGDVGWSTNLAVSCSNPDDPACDFIGAATAMFNDQYALGAADDQFICGVSDYDDIDSVGVDGFGNVFAQISVSSGLATDDYIGKGMPLMMAETVICQDDPIAESGGGEWGDMKSGTGLDVVPLIGTWYAIDQLKQVPSNQNIAAVVNGAATIQEGKDVFIWDIWDDPNADPDCSGVAVLDIDDIALSIQGNLLWSGQLRTGGDINFNNNDVVGYGDFVIFQEGTEVDGVPGALSAYFGRLSGGGSARHLSVDNEGNVAWVVNVVATYPGDNFPDDPNDTFEEQIDVVMYNGEVILATNDLIDQNDDGQINDNDFGAYLTNITQAFVIDGQDEAWFVGEGNLSVGLRDCVFRLAPLPNTTSPWLTLPDCGPDCQADIDGDGKVDQSDLGLLLSAFDACQGDPDYNADADIDGSGCVDQPDLGILLTEYEICGF